MLEPTSMQGLKILRMLGRGMPNTFDENFVPIGFNLEDLSDEDSDGSMPKYVPAMVQRSTKPADSNMPVELQYEGLLTKAMNKLKLIREARENTRFRLPLEVKRNIPTKTSINLREISMHLRRDEGHLQKFILNELLTTGSLNQEGKLYMKGRFTKTQIQEILREYIELFVVCKSCMKMDSTEIVKENKLIFLKCKGCGASRHVGGILEGYKIQGRTRPKLRDNL